MGGSMHDFIKIREIGRGSFGVVYLAKPTASDGRKDDLVVIKTIKINNKNSESVVKEAQMMRDLGDCKYIVEYRQAFVENQSLHIVMSFCPRGDLRKIISTERQLEPYVVAKYTFQLASALEFLHRHKVVHRDVKPENIFITESLDCRLGDLGTGKVLQHGDLASTFIGTAYYLAPEICNKELYNEKCDTWSLGCVIYEMAEGKALFYATTLEGAMKRIRAGPTRPFRLVHPQTRDVLRCLGGVLQLDTNKRFRAKDVREILKPQNIPQNSRSRSKTRERDSNRPSENAPSADFRAAGSTRSSARSHGVDYDNPSPQSPQKYLQVRDSSAPKIRRSQTPSTSSTDHPQDWELRHRENKPSDVRKSRDLQDKRRSHADGRKSREVSAHRNPRESGPERELSQRESRQHRASSAHPVRESSRMRVNNGSRPLLR